MTLIICPGVHAPVWTQDFLQQLEACIPTTQAARQVFAAANERPWSPYQLRCFLDEQAIAPTRPLIFIAFSAGCVAAISAAHYWSSQGKSVAAVIAFDGWGVPMAGPFPIYRLSHDAFTHHTSAWLGHGQASFYADPPVSHQALWRNPQHVRGMAMANREQAPAVATAMQFLGMCLERHLEG